MKLFTVLRAVLALAFMVSPAFAMTAASIPSKFNIPWGNSAGAGYIRTIPQASQIGIQNGAASLTDGFPPLTFLPVGSGGVPPFGQDFNGILNEITALSRWFSAAGVSPWDSTFSSAIGGYPQGAVVSGTSAGSLYVSTVDNNTSNPNSGGANWFAFTSPVTGDSGSGGASGLVPAPPAGSAAAGYYLGANGTFSSPLTTGEVQTFLLATCPAGTVEGNGGTIGNALSGGTLLASASASGLFSAMWVMNASVTPIFTSTGSPSSRGVSAAADFAANKRITVPDLRGTFPRYLDDGRGLDTGRVLGSQQSAATNTSALSISASSTFTGNVLNSSGTVNLTSSGGGSGIAQGIGSPTSSASIGVSGTPSGTVTTTATINGGGTETRPVNVALLNCVKL